MQRCQGRWAYGTDARASISVPKEVKRGGFESHSSWVANRINLSAMCPQDADGHDVPGEVRREEFVGSKLKAAHSPGASWLQGSHLACICKYNTFLHSLSDRVSVAWQRIIKGM